MRGNYVNFGNYGLKALEPGWVTARQIESSRIVISRVVRKIGKMWIRIFPDKPITARPAETRMGKGKGSLDHWVAVVKPGRILEKARPWQSRGRISSLATGQLAWVEEDEGGGRAGNGGRRGGGRARR
mgnify:CR=1 FL=1